MRAGKSLFLPIMLSLALAVSPVAVEGPSAPVKTAAAQSVGADLQAAVAFAQLIQGLYIQIMDYAAWLDQAELFIDDYWYDAATKADLEREIPPVLQEVKVFIGEVEGYLETADFTPPPSDTLERQEVYLLMAALPGDLLELLKEQLELTAVLYQATLAEDGTLYDALSADSMRHSARYLNLENTVLQSSLLSAEREHPQYGLTQSIIASNKAMEEFLLLFANIYADSAFDLQAVDKAATVHLNRSGAAIETSDEMRIAMDNQFSGQLATTDRDQALKEILLGMMDNYARAASIERSIIEALRQVGDLFVAQQEAAAQGKDIWPQVEGDFLQFQEIMEQLVSERLTLQDERVAQAGEIGRLLQ